MEQGWKTNHWPTILSNRKLIFFVAFTLRIAFLKLLFSMFPLEKIWETGFEAMHIASSLVAGNGFSSPFGGHTGPTAWVPPMYTFVIALFFKLFGSFSKAAALCLLTFNVFLESSVAVLISIIGEKALSRLAGTIAAWVWTLWIYELILGVKLWDTTLSAAMILFGCVLFYNSLDSLDPKRWGSIGAYWGLLILTNTTALVFFVVMLASNLRRRVVVASTFGFLLVVSPWIARDVVQLHKLLPVRSNFGIELFLGNHDGVTEPNDETMHPLGNAGEMASYRSLGEIRYAESKQQAALEFIKTHPSYFATLTARRVIHFWISPVDSAWRYISGLAFLGLLFCCRFSRVFAPFFAALLLYPLPYYITHADNWYRHPIEPFVLLLGAQFVVLLIVSLKRRVRGAPGC